MKQVQTDKCKNPDHWMNILILRTCTCQHPKEVLLDEPDRDPRFDQERFDSENSPLSERDTYIASHR